MHDATDKIRPTSATLVCVVCVFPVPAHGQRAAPGPAGMLCLLLVSCNQMYSCTTTVYTQVYHIASLCLCCKVGTLILCILGELLFDTMS